MLYPKISIIIPVYNVEPYIADCLQSVMHQTYQGPLECILVDDCGTDKSMEIVEKLIAEYDGTIVFSILHHEHNRGLSAARNTGVAAAKGEYVYFLDSDDWISDDCIEKLARPLRELEYDIVVGDFKVVGELPYHLELSLPEGPYHEFGITQTFCNGGVYVMAVNKLYKIEFLLKNHLLFEEGKVHEDDILAFELSCLEKSFYVVKSTTYFYRIRENSIITSTNVRKKLEGYLGVFESVRGKVERYEGLDGIYDFYLCYVRKMFSWLSKIDLDDEMIRYSDERTNGFLDIIPNMFCLKNKHNRLVYYACRNNQTYSRFEYVTKIYANRIQGRVLRNTLNLFPVIRRCNRCDFK